MGQENNLHQNLYMAQPRYIRPDHRQQHPEYVGSQRQHQEPNAENMRGNNYHAGHYHNANVPDLFA